MFIVAVRYQIRAEDREAFEEAILTNAAASLREEADCHRFDVSFDETGTHCFLYENYMDRAAFEAHRATPHFAKFREGAMPMVVDRRAEFYTRAENPY